MSPAAAAAPPEAPRVERSGTAESVEELKDSLRRLLSTLLENACGIALESVQRMADSLDEMAARGGVQPAALLGGLTAKLAGRNPLIGAVSGAFGALSPGAKAALVLALVLAVVLLPVTVLLVLLALIIGALVLWARSAG